MKWFQWASSPVGRRVLTVLTVLIVLSIAMNPDLLPFLSLIDAVGLDVLLWLIGAQFIGWVTPMMAWALPVLRRLAEVLALPATFLLLVTGCWLQLRHWRARLFAGARW